MNEIIKLKNELDGIRSKMGGMRLSKEREELEKQAFILELKIKLLMEDLK